jgi:uncharacterized membrane protein YjjP (DUF1212 family)
VTPTCETGTNSTAASTHEAIGVLLQFGSMMVRSGSTATRARVWLELIAKKIGFDAISVSVSLDCITVSGSHSDGPVTAMRNIGPPGINACRIAELEQLAKRLVSGASPRQIAEKLAGIEATPPLYSSVPIALAVGAASGGFAFLSGAAMPEITAAAIGGGGGQWLRLWLSRRQFNHYGAVTVCAVAASGVYVLAAALASSLGFGFSHYAAGFIASVLFLVPGVPLIAGLFDLLQYQTVAAMSRIAYGAMILLAVGLGLSIVVAVAGVDMSRQPPFELSYPSKVLFRAVASFVAGGAFAMLFNSPARAVLAAGLLGLAANDLRLFLNDMGMMLAPATFLAALTIGIVALLLEQRFDISLMATTVSPIIIMMPGLYAFETIVLFNHSEMVKGLQAAASCGFVIGALAMGLAASRFFQQRMR